MQNSPIEEKWIVAFYKRSSTPKIQYRQFAALGFYEAYDLVMSFSEKTSYNILWFKEKRKCTSLYNANMEIPSLESICTYCNNGFNEIEPIVCNFDINEKCKSVFCSVKCRQEHNYYKHIKK